MAENCFSYRASLTVVAGRPGSGKTTLARLLARTIRCPVLCRDEFKEGMVNSLPIGTPLTDAIQHQTNDVFFETVGLLLKYKVTLIAEAAFQHKLWAPRLEPLSAVADIRIIVCTVDPSLARSRHIERGLTDPERERFHDDRPVQAAREGRQLPLESYDPPSFDAPTIVVDTTDGYRPSLEHLVSFAREKKMAGTMAC